MGGSRLKKLFLTTVFIVAFGFASATLGKVAVISPEDTRFDVHINGSTKVVFTVYGFTGDLDIKLENMGLMKVHPRRVRLTSTPEGTPLELTFYGAPS